MLADHGISVTVADARFAKPIDAGLAAQLAAEHELLVTVEEGVLAGGFGSAVWETLSDAGIAARILRVGLPDRYVTHGAPRLLHEEVGFTGERIAERIEAAVAEHSGVRLARVSAGLQPGKTNGPHHAGRSSGRGEMSPCVVRVNHEAQIRRRKCDLDHVPFARMKRVRLDTLLSERGMFPSRSRAAASVLAGEVLLLPDRRRADKPGQLVREDVELELRDRPRFASRGGQKLANALDALGLDVAGRRALDVGASTGGFTDCLLQRGAEHVVAVDVAYGELDWRLRNDPRDGDRAPQRPLAAAR